MGNVKPLDRMATAIYHGREDEDETLVVSYRMDPSYPKLIVVLGKLESDTSLKHLATIDPLSPVASLQGLGLTPAWAMK